MPLPGGGAEPQYFGVGHDITKRKEAEEAARRRVELESIVAAVSTRLASATLDTVDLAVDFALGETGRCLGAGRVSLYLLAPDAIRLERVRLWRRETGLLEDGDPSQSVERLGWLRERAAGGLPVVVHAVDELPPEAEAEREALVQMGVEAVLAVPVLQEPTLAGLLCYEIEAAPATERTGAGTTMTYLWSDLSRMSWPVSSCVRRRAQSAQRRRQLPGLRLRRGQEPRAYLPRGWDGHRRRRGALHAAARSRTRHRGGLERARRAVSEDAGRGQARHRRYGALR